MICVVLVVEQKEMEKHASTEGEKDAKQQKKQKNMSISCKQGRQTDKKSNRSLTKHTKGLSMIIEEPNLWVPRVGSHWGFDDGKNCWDSLPNSNDEGDDVSELGNMKMLFLCISYVGVMSMVIFE